MRSKIVHHEEALNDLRNTIAERDRELHKQKDKSSSFDVLKSREEDLNGQVLMKDVTIGNLKQAINELNQEKLIELSEKNASERKVEKMVFEL